MDEVISTKLLFPALFHHRSTISMQFTHKV